MLKIRQLLSTKNKTQVYNRSLFRQAINQPCLLCRSTEPSPHKLCRDCEHSLPFISHPCTACSLPLAQPQDTEFSLINSRLLLCGQCQKQPVLTRGIALTEYHFPISNLITRFKHQANFPSGAALSELLAEKILCEYEDLPLPEYQIPVPLHPNRLRYRGFNQSLEIAKMLKKSTHVPILNHSVERRINTPAQQTLSATKRSKNLNNAFSVKTDMKRNIAGRHLVIIDDVITTGTTARSLASTLIKAGAKRIDVWALARTPL